MSEHFEQTYTSSDGDNNITYIQYIQPDNINVLIPNEFITTMKEEYLEHEDDESSYSNTREIEVLESVINMGVKHKIKMETHRKELVEISESKPKGRKRAVPDQTRDIRKVRANTNQAYINSKGNEVKPKAFDELFVCGCPKKCTMQVSIGLGSSAEASGDIDFTMRPQVMLQFSNKTS